MSIQIQIENGPRSTRLQINIRHDVEIKNLLTLQMSIMSQPILQSAKLMTQPKSTHTHTPFKTWCQKQMNSTATKTWIDGGGGATGSIGDSVKDDSKETRGVQLAEAIVSLWQWMVDDSLRRQPDLS